MNRKLKFISILFFMLAISVISATANVKTSPDGVWKEIDDTDLRRRPVERLVEPDGYRTFRLDKAALQTFLQNAPEEFSSQSRTGRIILTLPLPDGTFSRFDIKESSIMETGLAEKYPNIKTFNAQGIDDPSATARLSFSPTGFRGMILSRAGTIMIDPYFFGDTENYISYAKADLHIENQFVCLFKNQFKVVGQNYKDFLDLGTPFESVTSGASLRKYRLALAATGEYTNVFRQAGDTDAQAKARALEQQVLIMNRVNGVYEKDLAIRMIIIANNDAIIYTNPTTDPYTNDDPDLLLDENQSNIDTVITSPNYDIGHVFSTGGGGVAILGATCDPSVKAQGETGLPNPVGDTFAIDFVAHEIGHQFGALHTFNTSCGGNRDASAAYEPGSGVTIMAYASVCGAQDLANHSIDTFHVKSLEEIVAYSQNDIGNSCAVQMPTGNTPPTVTTVGGSSFNIPKQTPFALTASGTDANSDTITYDWQEYDLGASTSAIPNSDSTGTARPIFRPYLPTTNPTRVFPALTYILNNANVPPSTYSCGRSTPCLTGELLPAISRTMNFQVIARDNRANGGGINTATAQVIVNGNSGPFAVTAPNTSVIFQGGVTQTITWDVNNTTAAPVSAANVKISLSIDGGNTFPFILRGATPNDGTESVSIPQVTTNTARIKIEAVGNVFFDISNTNFTISQTATPMARAPFDFDGDNKTDVSIFRSNTGEWWYLKSSDGGNAAFQFGLGTDRKVPADYTGDGKADFAFWRPTTGDWYILRSEDFSFYAFKFGSPNDIPVPGDYDGDGKADSAVFRPSTNTWYILKSSGGVTIQTFGTSGDKPIVADYDGDGKSDIAIFRQNGTSGGAEWWILRSTAGLLAVQFGSSFDVKALPGDYTGDGKADISYWHSGTRMWYVLRSEDFSYYAFPFGISNDIPVPGDYDGDGKYDAAFYRGVGAQWYVQRSTGGTTIQIFGQDGDYPVPNVYVP